VAPAKRKPSGGYKQSDDNILMIATLTLALRIRPDFVTLVAADGDFTPLVWALRDEGIRTEVVANRIALASELERAAWGVIDMDIVLAEIQRRARR
jgi:uncharacterized LabA/DUF88 family protein